MMTYPMSITQILDHVNNIHSDKQIHTLLHNGKLHTYTFNTLCERVYHVMNALIDYGINPGDRIATYAANTYQHLELYYAIPCIGAIINPLNIRLGPKQLAEIVKEADDKLIFVDDNLRDTFSKLQEEIEFVPTIRMNSQVKNVYIEDNLSLEYEEFLTMGEDKSRLDIQDENWGMALCYTSGTTGEPRGVLYTHRSMFLHTLAVNQADIFGITEKDVVMPMVPMFHAMGWGIPYAAMFAGADIVLPGTNPENIIDLISELGVTIAAGVPTVWTKLLPELRINANRISSLRRLIIGGETIPSTLIETLEQELGIEVRHAWGMTEMSPTGTFCTLRHSHQNLTDNEKWKIKAMQGPPIPGVQVRIKNEKDTELPWDGDSIGELQVRSHWATSSYYKIGTTPDHFTRDGWLRTGDMATINSEGFMQIVDRAKSIIRSGGESIPSIPLESFLLKHPQVLEVSVVGIPDKTWGERPIAVVILDEGVNEDIIQLLKQHLVTEFPKFWIPDQFVVVDEIPKTGVGKIDKNAILQIVTSKNESSIPE